MKAIIIGCGRVGSAIAVEIDRNGWDVTAIDEQEDGVDRLGSHWAGGFVQGHGMDLAVHGAAGIEHADAVVVATCGDNSNTVVSQVAKERFNVSCVVVRLPDPARADFYREPGLHVSCQLAQAKYGVEKVSAPVNDARNQPHADLLGIAPAVCASVVVVLRDGNAEPATPAYRLAAGDQMLAIVKPGRTDELRKALALT